MRVARIEDKLITFFDIKGIQVSNGLLMGRPNALCQYSMKLQCTVKLMSMFTTM
jgi:hypothetical protein